MATQCPRAIRIAGLNVSELQTILSFIDHDAEYGDFSLTATDLTISHLTSSKVALVEYQIKTITFESYIFPATLSVVTFSADLMDVLSALKLMKSNLVDLTIPSPSHLVLKSPSCVSQIPIINFKANKITDQPACVAHVAVVDTRTSKEVGCLSFWQSAIL